MKNASAPIAGSANKDKWDLTSEESLHDAVVSVVNGSQQKNDFRVDHLKGDELTVAKVVLRILGKNPSGGCRAFWTAEEWLARNEKYGTDSVLVLVHDGGDLATVCNWDYGRYDLSEKLTEALKVAGYYYEQCTSWYSAVYRLPAAG